MTRSTRLQWPSTGIDPIIDDATDIDSLRLPGLVGRDKEVADIRCLIDDPRVRLLTLTGPAGVGKSRLAHEVLARGEFRTGPDLTVDLVEASTRLDVWAATLAASAHRSEDHEIHDVDTTLDLLAAGIGGDRILLLLDNCDLVAGLIAHDVARLLRQCPRLVVMVTSRIVLNLHREYVVGVRPLRSRSDSGPYRPGSSPAAQLLLAGIDSRYRSSAANRAVLDEIAHELDGVPLALELAANTVNSIGSAQTLRLIRSGAGLSPLPYLDVPERHRSLYDAVAWGMDRLDDGTVDVLLHLSLCESAVDPDTVALLADLAQTAVGTALATLMGHSLLERRVTDAGQPRYAVIATVRDYCHRLLETDGVRGERIRRAHVDRCHDLALRVARELDRPDRYAGAVVMAGQRVADFRATVGRLVELGRAAQAVRMCELLEDIWIRFGCLTDIEGMLTRFVDDEPDTTSDPAVPAALELLGRWAVRTRRAHRAIDLRARAAEAYRRNGDTAGAHRVSTQHDPRAEDRADPRRALETYRGALRVPESRRPILDTLAAVEGCAHAYRAAGPEFGEQAELLFGAVHHIRTVYAIPLPDDIDDARTAYLIRPESARDLHDVVTAALSGPPIPAQPDSPLEVLTGRQREIALLVADALTNRMIASRLGIAEWTVVNHLRQVMAKLNCPSRLHVTLVVKGEHETVEHPVAVPIS
ncbi:ATP-binding protein [Nocardia crassostreae]|uniref:ATP-binding protein n=1 Tax=Nocardia crassostreae TaxID=53428 RepID=UPI00082B3EA3|nr:LuxR C-terminal-related transcriptional regulator [Nocardia crassostreae]